MRWIEPVRVISVFRMKPANGVDEYIRLMAYTMYNSGPAALLHIYS